MAAAPGEPACLLAMLAFVDVPKANERVFARAVDEVTRAAHELLDALVTNAPPRDRAVQASRARAKAAGRFGAPHAKPAT